MNSYQHDDPAIIRRSAATVDALNATMDRPINGIGNGGNDYAKRHNDAIRTPRIGHERAIVLMATGLIEYAEAHADKFECDVLDDGVLGDEVTAIARALIGLLNGETGRLDCGTLDGVLRSRFLPAEER